MGMMSRHDLSKGDMIGYIMSSRGVLEPNFPSFDLGSPTSEGARWESIRSEYEKIPIREIKMEFYHYLKLK